MAQQQPHVVIIGGGFAGLNAAMGLRSAPVRVTVIDRRNHHVFQPLLYQVATASLSPAQIAAPIRKVLSGQANAEVILAEVVSIDTAAREVVLTDGREKYDYLVIAAGATHSYFGHEGWEADAPGLKSLEDATEIRRRFLMAFETAERETDEGRRRAALTFVVVGGGATGVEMAGAMAEIARKTIVRDFRHINTASARVILLDAGARLLAAYPEDLSARAKRDLEQMGVEVRLGAMVTGIDAGGVSVGAERIESGCVMWAAGVKASPVAGGLGAPLDRAGRVLVNPDLSVPGCPGVYVAGDLASLKQANGEPVPGVAPAAMQMGRFVAGEIRRRVKSTGHEDVTGGTFRYVNKGEIATIGRARAVGVLGFGTNLPLTGFICWAGWALIHITYLIGFRNRLLVMIDWVWSYLFFERGARLITGAGSPRRAAESRGGGDESRGRG